MKYTKIEQWRCHTCYDRLNRNVEPIKNCKACFNNESRRLAEEQLSKLSGNPITKTIASNKIWNDHLKRCGIRKQRI